MIDHEHFIDKQNSIKYHLYEDRPFKITDVESKDRLAGMSSFNPQLQALFQQMREKLSRMVTEKETVAFEEAFDRVN